MNPPTLFKTRASQKNIIHLWEPEPDSDLDSILQPEPSCLSFRSNHSKSEPLQFKGGLCTSEPDQSHFFLPRVHQGPDSDLKPKAEPEPSCLSLKSNQSKAEPLQLKTGGWTTDPDLG
ncbi:hypothetical protein GOODEAATRI_032162 [Goodea atripinnis]|uniref:Prolactin receptor n=1 Tax=Goodea atripinnis TaxID=208336 RepID=A0ABV0NZE4_9TELE